MFGAKVALSRAIGAASRASGRGGGTTLPGRVLLRLEPEAIARLGAGLDRGATIVSATNGKTTTAGMIAGILAADGRHPVHNRAGSNMTWGVATALLEQRGAEGLFEVDEAWLPRVAEQLDPGLIVLGNLFRDQLDRYGEMEALAEDWAKTVAARAGRTQLALNADDPLIADLGRDAKGSPHPGVVHFGLEDKAQALP
ncbi:MAG TPA: Mur ligase family protein, partial [Solirubrobacterales bacterium]|nr:Mur ligase family protein [Solirubrobacterales bacterium]